MYYLSRQTKIVKVVYDDSSLKWKHESEWFARVFTLWSFEKYVTEKGWDQSLFDEEKSKNLKCQAILNDSFWGSFSYV